MAKEYTMNETITALEACGVTQAPAVKGLILVVADLVKKVKDLQQQIDTLSRKVHGIEPM